MIIAGLDVRTLYGTLFWSNITLSVLIFGLFAFGSHYESKWLVLKFGLAKILQATSFLLLFYRGIIPFYLSGNLGNSLLCIGLYFDSIVILTVSGQTEKRYFRLQFWLMAIGTICYNFLCLFSNNSNQRVFFAAVAAILLLMFPMMHLTFGKNKHLISRFLGTIILLFMFFMLMRALGTITSKDIGLLTSDNLLNITNISFICISTFMSAGVLLLMSERAHDLTKKMATLDPLTMIPNRSYFLEKASAYFERSVKAEQSVSVLFIDIDYFKKTNDTYGHLFGDEVIIKLGKTLEKSIRPCDLCCRYGGDEFIVYLQQADRDASMVVANRIKEQIALLRFQNIPDFRCTVSIGVYTNVPTEETSVMAYIDKSDNALYAAKCAGRDRIFMINNQIDTTQLQGW